jgi:protein-tyrosine-phosphatase
MDVPGDATGAKDAEMSEEQAGAAPPRTTTFNILFVCTGNTCRSPLAEGIAREELERRGWRNVRVASAGLAARGGEGATGHAVAVAGRDGVDISGHRSQPLTPELAGWADLILAMGPSHLAAVDRIGGGEKAATLGDFVAGADGAGSPVADPFGGPEEVYEETYRELRALITAAFDRLAPILAP